MAEGGIDAYLYFSRGTVGRGAAAPRIEGETKDNIESSSTSDWGASMQIQSYDLGFTMVTDQTEETLTNTGEHAAHNPEFGDVSIRKYIDKASPRLLEGLHMAARYEWARIVQRKAGGVPGQSGDYFWEIELGGVAIKSLKWSASDSSYPAEDITLEYDTITAYYRPQKRTGELIYKAIETPCLGERAPSKRKGKHGEISGSQFEDLVARVVREIKNKHVKV